MKRLVLLALMLCTCAGAGCSPNSSTALQYLSSASSESSLEDEIKQFLVRRAKPVTESQSRRDERRDTPLAADSDDELLDLKEQKQQLILMINQLREESRLASDEGAKVLEALAEARNVLQEINAKIEAQRAVHAKLIADFTEEQRRMQASKPVAHAYYQPVASSEIPRAVAEAVPTAQLSTVYYNYNCQCGCRRNRRR